MNNFYVRGIVSNLIALLVLLACLFGPAGTLSYWQGWAFAIVFGVCSQAIGIYFLIDDRQLLERRMKVGPIAETTPAQKIISTLFVLGFIVTIVFPAFDHRLGWSPVAPAVSVIGDGLVALSFVLFFRVLEANSWAAATVQVEAGQAVIATGPYGIVRHPMYAAVLVLLVGIPLALGSWWGVFLILVFLPIIAWRLLDEEQYLRKNLPGYEAYTARICYRLVPGIW